MFFGRICNWVECRGSKIIFVKMAHAYCNFVLRVCFMWSSTINAFLGFYYTKIPTLVWNLSPEFKQSRSPMQGKIPTYPKENTI